MEIINLLQNLIQYCSYNFAFLFSKFTIIMLEFLEVTVLLGVSVSKEHILHGIISQETARVRTYTTIHCILSFWLI